MVSEGTTLLIVEDNYDLRNGLKEILAYEGYAVLDAANGLEALELMQGANLDLIISDISMPEMDGFEFFEKVRAKPEGIAIPFIFLTARGERDDIMKGRTMGAEDYLVKPVTRSELVKAVEARLARFRQLQAAQMEAAYQDALTALANGIEVRDQYTRGHVERVTDYSLAIAEELGWQGKHMESLRFGAILHDIGKIFVHETVLSKPGPLNAEEFMEMARHPNDGAGMLRDIPYLQVAVPVIRCHHEKWDGSGYPDGLAGEQIPIEARIISVADVFDAMTTDRPYHRAESLETAFGNVLEMSGKHFDPQVVEAFQRVWESGKVQQIAVLWSPKKTQDKAPAVNHQD